MLQIRWPHHHRYITYSNLQGNLKGFDQTINIILEESHERVFSTGAGTIEGLHVLFELPVRTRTADWRSYMVFMTSPCTVFLIFALYSGVLYLVILLLMVHLRVEFCSCVIVFYCLNWLCDRYYQPVCMYCSVLDIYPTASVGVCVVLLWSVMGCALTYLMCCRGGTGGAGTVHHPRRQHVCLLCAFSTIMHCILTSVFSLTL